MQGNKVGDKHDEPDESHWHDIHRATQTTQALDITNVEDNKTTSDTANDMTGIGHSLSEGMPAMIAPVVAPVDGA